MKFSRVIKFFMCLIIFSNYPFFKFNGPSYPFGPYYGLSSSSWYESIIPPDHDEYDMDYFFPGSSFEYNTQANYQNYDMTNNSDDDGLFVY